MSAQLPATQKYKELYQFMNSRKQGLQNLLPKSIAPERLIQAALYSTNRVPKLLDCTRESWQLALIESAQLGLLPDSVNQYAHLIPYKNEVKLIPGYRGLIRLALNSGRIAKIWARVAREGEPFEVYYGTEDKIVHRPQLDGAAEPMRLAYAIAKLKDGSEYQFEVLTLDQIEWIKSKSSGASRGDSPWNDIPYGYEEMAKKSAIRRLYKVLPTNDKMDRAIELDNADFPEGNPYESIDADYEAVEPQSVASQVKQAIAGKANKQAEAFTSDPEQALAIAEEFGLTADEVERYCQEHYGTPLQGVPVDQYKALLAAIREGNITNWLLENENGADG